jgi:pimeloyl-ACP methyl ester carboxylesterase
LHRITASALAIGAALTIAFAGAAGAATGPVKGPKGDAFYTAPKHLPKGVGEVIWQRKAKGLMQVDGAQSNTLVLYTTATEQGKTAPVSGVVSVPKGKPPKQGWPVISFAHGTTGIADICAPSRIVAGGPNAGSVSYSDPQVAEWVNAGYAVVRTDYRGLGTPGEVHPYIIGEPAGRSVVDIVTASRELGLDIGKKYLIAGHSQGGHAALWAAGPDAQKFAPKLKLRGTVAYAPASHLAEQADLLPALTSPSGLSAIVALIIRGTETQSPQIIPSQILSDPAFALYPTIDQVCLDELGKADSYGGIAPADMQRDGSDLSPVLNVLREQNPAVKTKAPILMLQGTADNTVFPFTTDMLNDELVNLGDQVTYSKYDGVDHVGILSAAEAEALAFMEKQLPPG